MNPCVSPKLFVALSRPYRLRPRKQISRRLRRDLRMGPPESTDLLKRNAADAARSFFPISRQTDRLQKGGTAYRATPRRVLYWKLRPQLKTLGAAPDRGSPCISISRHPIGREAPRKARPFDKSGNTITMGRSFRPPKHVALEKIVHPRGISSIRTLYTFIKVNILAYGSSSPL